MAYDFPTREKLINWLKESDTQWCRIAGEEMDLMRVWINTLEDIVVSHCDPVDMRDADAELVRIAYRRWSERQDKNKGILGA